MSSIVEQLVAVTKETDNVTSSRLKDLCAMAAVEIICLRDQIEKLRQVAGAVSIESPSYDDIRKEIKG